MPTPDRVDPSDADQHLRHLEQAVRAAKGQDFAVASAQLAQVLAGRGRLEDAGAVLDRAVAEVAESADLLLERGNLNHSRGGLPQSIADYDAAIRLRPTFAEAYYNRGNAMRDLGRVDEAAASFVQAAALRPDLAEAHNNLGNLEIFAGRPASGIPHYRRALAVRPAFTDAWFNMGNALKALGRFEEALAAYVEVGRLAPRHAGAWNNAGEALEKLGRMPDAARCYEEAIACDARLPQPRRNLGTLLFAAGRVTEALALFRAVVELAPAWGDGLASLVHSQLHVCDWTDLEPRIARLAAAVSNGQVVPPFVTATLPLPSPVQTRAAVQWAASIDNPPAPRLPSRPPAKGRPIRVGYLSADFHAHATAFLLADLIEQHDRSRFEIRAYSYGPDDGSAIRTRLVRAFDAFADLRADDDLAAAERIHADEIDILVDLKGYTLGARTRILCHRPAPIQVNWLGFPGSMGADFIDYVIADAIVAPVQFQADCVERIVRLPDCFQPNDARRARPRPTTRAAHGLPDTGFVFCSFNNSYKFVPDVFESWMRLLRRVPGSVLWLLAPNDLVRSNLAREASARGVDPGRLVFAPRTAPQDHLDRHGAADLFLDTLPVNALTTGSDALWAGLPVVTAFGETVAGRGCASLLHAVGLDDLVAPDLEAYEELAFRLASEPDRLAAVRGTLAAALPQAPLFDTPRFARNLEAAYGRMQAIRAAGEKPCAFSV